MTNKQLFCAGGTGTVIAAVCCFTPLLVVLLGAIGLSSWLGWLDYVLLPALAIFAAITVIGFIRMKRQPAAAATESESGR